MKVALFALVVVVGSLASIANAKTTNIDPSSYQEFPRRTAEEAAVLEWGHSAIISALDASVARFGPQTSQAALLEVECMPILASPLNGVGYGNDDPESSPVRALDNADDVHGNMVVMTNNGGLTGVEMAKIAKLSGAAALLVVNTDDKRPDDIYRMEVMEGESAEDVDIPVVMVSLNSANVLTTATVTAGMDPSEVVNHGMPDRVRLYAGGDRPFFEDVEPAKPTLYLIHNLLTDEEVDELVKTAESKVSPIEGKDDMLQLTTNAELFPGVKRVMLWQGMIQGPGQKAIEERVEQVTGFPATHFSDWVIDKLEAGAKWEPHYDTHPYMIPMATITVFLTEYGEPITYPESKKPVKIRPSKGMAIVHHNTDERHKLDKYTLHAMESTSTDGAGPVYIARKYIFTEPVSNARRIAVPAFAFPFGGKLPGVVSLVHDKMVDQFGTEDGSKYFDKLCVFLPMLLVLLIAQSVAEYVQAQVKGSGDNKKKKSEKDEKPTQQRRGKKGKKE